MQTMERFNNVAVVPNGCKVERGKVDGERGKGKENSTRAC